jgi:EAL domain-containing protein (putative c-di-GMP-specific phosphodiesterase class I)
MPDGGAAEAEARAAEVLGTIRGMRVLTASGRPRAVSASLGIAVTSDGRLTADDVLVEADLAMYDAKEAGRDRFGLSADGADPTRLSERLSWADRIRDALEEDRFELHAQPVVSLDGERVEQHELLLRMRDDDGVLVAPAVFLPVAERFDLIGAIDRWVARRAIRLLADPRLADDVVLAVNIAGRSVGDPELLRTIEEELRATRAEPCRLVFEITETTAVTNMESAREFATRLAELGCRSALDDFGTGFGSFHYLKHLPVDYLKIDGEFVRHCAVNPTDRLMIEAIVGIARGMGKITVAEHVGDRETLELVRRLGVDLAQGFLLGRPAPLEPTLLPPLAPSSLRARTTA